ncbi:hypothetical protein SBA2_40060 [Acidobacteriia bacterium SbA2]|nr:hypothetical protein SBA2_40060 [Acidobacteriia bacterium SbA2]
MDHWTIFEGVIPNPGAVQPVRDLALVRRGSVYAGDPFDFAQGRLFPPPERRLRSG